MRITHCKLKHFIKFAKYTHVQERTIIRVSAPRICLEIRVMYVFAIRLRADSFFFLLFSRYTIVLRTVSLVKGRYRW